MWGIGVIHSLGVLCIYKIIFSYYLIISEKNIKFKQIDQSMFPTPINFIEFIEVGSQLKNKYCSEYSLHCHHMHSDKSTSMFTERIIRNFL